MCSNTQRKFHWKLIFLLFFWVSQVLYSAAVFNLFCWQKFCKTGDLVVFRINEGLSKVHASVGHRCTSDWRAVRQSALIFHSNNLFWKPAEMLSSLYLHYKWFEGNIVVLSLTSLLQRPRCTAVCLSVPIRGTRYTAALHLYSALRVPLCYWMQFASRHLWSNFSFSTTDLPIYLQMRNLKS